MKRYSLLTMMIVLCLFSGMVVSAERIVVIGDSITGHSLNLPYGFTHQVRGALADAGVSDVEFIPLGGSGQTIISWQSILKNSENENPQLDIPGIFVKTELDKGADIILVHLGMNDALCPTVTLRKESLAAWKTEYQKLIDAIRKRIFCQRLILSSPTMLTESPYFYKNLLMDRLGEIVKEVAEANGAEFLDIRGDFKKYFENARLTDGTVRFTLDFVHPNEFGHQIMTWSILDGIGQKEAAEKYYAERVATKLRDFNSPGLSLFVTNGTTRDRIVVHGKIRGANVDSITVSVPTGVTVEKIEKESDDAFVILLLGHAQTLGAEMTVQADKITRNVRLNPPYHVLSNFSMAPYSSPEEFDRSRAITQIDRDILAGKNPLESVINGNPTLWTDYYPTPDATGADNPNAVDLCAFPFADAFDAGYVVREIWSPKEQSARLKMNSEGFSTTAINTVYLNGKEIYFGCLSPRHVKAEDEIRVELKKGRNLLAARIDHTNWQWGVSFALEAEGLSF